MSAVLELKHICASYKGHPVLRDVSLELKERTTVGLVGESGSGKSTLARVITGLLEADGGELWLDGRLLGRRRKEDRRKVQMVFQNPEGSFNPKHTIGRILSDAMLFHGITDSSHVNGLCQEWVKRMQLPEDTLRRYPRSFSGGQKQRIALARALCVRPELLIADEPTSALDVSVQLQMLRLIEELREEMGLTILFISHDMGVIHYISDEVAVMRSGEIVEIGEKASFFAAPKTEYGNMLLDCVPVLETGGK